MSLRSRNRKQIPYEDFFLDITMLLERKLKNRGQIPSEDFFRDNQTFATEIKFCSPKWVVK